MLLPFGLIGYRSSQRALLEAALTDPLTGLANRRKLMGDLEDRLRTASEERPLMLALFDLDGFKSYNDSFGHPAGDALLMRMADQLRGELRGVADAYRIGGDEFCVLVPGGLHAFETMERTSRALGEQGESGRAPGWVPPWSHSATPSPERPTSALATGFDTSPLRTTRCHWLTVAARAPSRSASR
jgi:GGDEF domain-containing protein